MNATAELLEELGVGLSYLRMTDDTLSPWKNRGDVVVVSRAEVRIGCFVAVKRPESYLVGLLVALTPSIVTVEQLQPSERFAIPLDGCSVLRAMDDDMLFLS